jgi:hypothetical protein
MVLIFFGFAGEGFKQKEEAQLKPGSRWRWATSSSGTTPCRSPTTARSR